MYAFQANEEARSVSTPGSLGLEETRASLAQQAAVDQYIYIYMYLYLYLHIIETACCATHSIWMLRDCLQSLGSCTASKR